jgi:hypothetical protein
MYCQYRDENTQNNYVIPADKTDEFYAWLGTDQADLPDYARLLGTDLLVFDNPVVDSQPLFA